MLIPILFTHEVLKHSGCLRYAGLTGQYFESFNMCYLSTNVSFCLKWYLVHLVNIVSIVGVSFFINKLTGHALRPFCSKTC